MRYGRVLAQPVGGLLFGPDYDPDQPRDPAGRWGEGGFGGHAESKPKDEPSSDSPAYASLKTMPSSIEGVSIQKKPLQGSMLAIGGSSGIAVSTSRRAGAAWKDMEAYQKKAFEAGWSSSPHPNHVIWHELAHVKVKNDPNVNESYLTNLHGLSNPHFKTIASKVSKYAGTNGHEFVAEVYAARRAGRKFDADVMDFYKGLKGPAV